MINLKYKKCSVSISVDYYQIAKRIMKPTLLLFCIVAFLIQNVYAEKSAEEFIAGFVSGKYHLIGKRINTEDTYLGDVEINASGTEIEIKKNIQSKVIIGTGTIESVTADNIIVLRFRFIENSVDIEEICLIDSDLDNYARLTCYLYQKDVRTNSPGMEAMFIKKRF